MTLGSKYRTRYGASGSRGLHRRSAMTRLTRSLGLDGPATAATMRAAARARDGDQVDVWVADEFLAHLGAGGRR